MHFLPVDLLVCVHKITGIIVVGLDFFTIILSITVGFWISLFVKELRPMNPIFDSQFL